MNVSQDPVALARHYRAVRALTEQLAAPLSDADATIQSMPDASPAKWHLAHTTWFFETFVLRDHVADYRPYRAEWPFLFNSYYEAEGPIAMRLTRRCWLQSAICRPMCWRWSNWAATTSNSIRNCC